MYVDMYVVLNKFSVFVICFYSYLIMLAYNDWVEWNIFGYL
jgi:hypothetical protein